MTAPSRWYELLPPLLLSGVTLGLCMLPWSTAYGAVDPDSLSFYQHWQLSLAGVRLDDLGRPFVVAAVDTDAGSLCLIGSAVTLGIALLEFARGLCWLPRWVRCWLPVPGALLAAGAVAWMMTETRGSMFSLSIDRTDAFYAAVVAAAAVAMFTLGRALGVGRRRQPTAGSAAPAS